MLAWQTLAVNGNPLKSVAGISGDTSGQPSEPARLSFFRKRTAHFAEFRSQRDLPLLCLVRFPILVMKIWQLRMAWITRPRPWLYANPSLTELSRDQNRDVVRAPSRICRNLLHCRVFCPRKREASIVFFARPEGEGGRAGINSG